MYIPGASQTPETATCKTAVIFLVDHMVWDLNAWSYFWLYFQIAQVQLDCAVILLQASAPVTTPRGIGGSTSTGIPRPSALASSEALCKPLPMAQLSPARQQQSKNKSKPSASEDI